MRIALAAIIFVSATSHAMAQAVDPTFSELRSMGEDRVRSSLIDPSSAQFEWPYDFVEGTWQTILKSRSFEGRITCGFVNSKNRMGGYVGRAAFVVVVKDGAVAFAEVGSPRGSDFTSRSCLASAKAFPPAPASPPTALMPASSVADELGKLASLRDRGVITEAEFQVQKKKILGEQ